MKIGDFNINEIHLQDSYKAIKQLPDKSIDQIYTDIPYLYVVGGGDGGSEINKRIQKTKKTDISHIMDGIDYSILDEFVRIMKKINIFIWCSKLQIPNILNYFIDKGCYFEILVWCKTNPTPQTRGTWLPDMEYCLYFRQKGVKLNDGYELKSKFNVEPINTSDKKLFFHPTIKPLNMVKNHILHTTQEGDVIADFFAGSGTTGVAAKEAGRNFLLFEIEENYYELAKDRLNKITGTGQYSLF